jgi:ComF family protein
LKYQGVQALAPLLAAPLIDYIRTHPIPIDGLTPVPLHPQKLAERGFNQSELLAREIADSLNIPLRTNLIQRSRSTRSQAQLNREERQRNMAGAFSPLEGAHLDGQTILLIDDVATTGATLIASAQALKQIGAGDIWALTVARANIHTVLDGVYAGLSPVEAFLLWDSARREPTPDPSTSII